MGKLLALKLPNVGAFKEELIDLVKRVDTLEYKGFIRNGDELSGKVHLPKLEGTTIPAMHWKCQCEFKHGLADTVRINTLPDKRRLLCGKCFQKEKAELREENLRH